MKKMIGFGLLLLSFAPQWSAGQEKLDAYLRLGLSNNLVIQQKTIALDQAMNALKEAQTLYMPNLAFNASYTLAKGGRVIDLPLGDLLNGAYATLNQLTSSNRFGKLDNQSVQLNPNNFYDTKLRFTAPVFNPDIKYNIRIRQDQVSLTQLDMVIYQRELVKQIKTAFYQYNASVRAVAIYQNALALVNENQRINAALFSNGKVNKTVVLRSVNEVKKIESALTEAWATSVNARSYFNFLLNRPLTDTVFADSVSMLPPATDTIHASVTNREELQSLALAKNINANLVKLSNTYRLPKMSGLVDLGAQNFNFALDKHTPYVFFGLSLDWTLFSAGRNRYKAKEAEAALRNAENQAEYVQTQLLLEQRTALQSYLAAVKVYENNVFQQEAARRNYADLLKIYKEGQALYIELLDAQNFYINAQLQTSISLMNALTRYSEVERASSSYQLKK